MLTYLHSHNNLLLKIVFASAKSRRQTTPNLIKNPRLTSRGIISPPSKSYAYNIPENIPNRHLYWNNTEQNRIRRKQYNAHRLYKLGIKSIHDDQGEPLHNRSVQQVLQELSNLRLLKESLGRSLINLRQIATVYPQVMKNQDKQIVQWALTQVHDRSLSSMTLYQFSTYCYLRKNLGLPATRNMLTHLYKWIQAEVEAPSTKMRPKYFIKNIRYIFDTVPLNQDSQILYKKERQFALFEDVQPDNKPLIEMLPKLFTDEQIEQLRQDELFQKTNYKFLLKIPGGHKLHERINAN